jgi:hypothetical protein
VKVGGKISQLAFTGIDRQSQPDDENDHNFSRNAFNHPQRVLAMARSSGCLVEDVIRDIHQPDIGVG